MRRFCVTALLLFYVLSSWVAAQAPTPLPSTSAVRVSSTSGPTPQPSSTLTPTTRAVMVQLVTPTPSGYQSAGWYWNRDLLAWLEAILTFAALFTTIVSLWIIRYQHREDLKQVRLQMNQNLRHKAVELSIERNRQHLVEPEQFPADLPYWRDLSDEKKRWRVFLLNHLNLLYLIYEDHMRGLVDKGEFQDWKNKAAWMLGDVYEAESIGWEVLQQLLKPEEGVGSPKFREWLKQESVIPLDLFPATDD